MLFKILIGVVLGVIGGIVILEGGFGNISIKGSKKYEEYNKNADTKIKDMFKNGTGSSREDLQKWWEDNH
jgi:hypothetical protein